MPSLLDIRNLPANEIQKLLELSAQIKKNVIAGKEITPKARKAVGLLFFENSTRTRVSFEQACRLQGYHCITFSAGSSSVKKGETLKDTILTLKSERLDAVVIRHSSSGSAQLASRIFGGPVINGGDGQHEHPTQALGDALTILDHKPSIKGLKIAIVGDILHSRVARSNAWLLSKLGADVRLVGPRNLMPAHMGKLPGTVHYDLIPGIHDADVVMCLRLQKERMSDGLLSSTGEYRRQYQINTESLKVAKPDCIVMHPGPMNRGIEMDDFAADGPQSVILEQVTNGIYVRMAALQWAFEPSTKKVQKEQIKPIVKAVVTTPKKKGGK